MFNVDVDRSANAPLLLPSLKEHRCIGIVLWEQQLLYIICIIQDIKMPIYNI